MLAYLANACNNFKFLDQSQFGADVEGDVLPGFNDDSVTESSESSDDDDDRNAMFD